MISAPLATIQRDGLLNVVMAIKTLVRQSMICWPKSTLMRPAHSRTRWHELKWDCGLEWIPSSSEAATIYREDIPKILKAFKEMKGHCAWLQCLSDRAEGKVKHCYANDRRWR
jgi:hypothetical protein